MNPFPIWWHKNRRLFASPTYSLNYRGEAVALQLISQLRLSSLNGTLDRFNGQPRFNERWTANFRLVGVQEVSPLVEVRTAELGRYTLPDPAEVLLFLGRFSRVLPKEARIFFPSLSHTFEPVVFVNHPHNPMLHATSVELIEWREDIWTLVVHRNA